MKMLVASLLLGATLLVRPVSAGPAASDTSAIAAFLSIGFANIANNFTAIRGTAINDRRFKSTTWPDHTHFINCEAWILTNATYAYECNSSKRSGSLHALLANIGHAVQAKIPAGYTSAGEQRDADGAYQAWKRPGSPEVWLGVFPSKRKVFYEIQVIGAGTAAARSAPCNYWVDKDPDAFGANFISMCQSELDSHANDWRATSDPVEKGRNQLLMGLDYFALAYYCEYYFVDKHHSVDARCLHGKTPDFATTSINAAREAFSNAKRDSNNDPSVVERADRDTELARKLAQRYELPFDLNV